MHCRQPDLCFAIPSSYQLAFVCREISKQANVYESSRSPSDPRCHASRNAWPRKQLSSQQFATLDRASIACEHASPPRRPFDKETSSAAAHRLSTMPSSRAFKWRRRSICSILSHNAPSPSSQRQASPYASASLSLPIASPARRL